MQKPMAESKIQNSKIYLGFVVYLSHVDRTPCLKASEALCSSSPSSQFLLPQKRKRAGDKRKITHCRRCLVPLMMELVVWVHDVI